MGQVESGDQVKKIVGIQKAMTKTMTAALSIPFFSFSDDMDCTELFALRRSLKEQVPGLSPLPFFIKAISLAMEEYPIINSTVNPEVDADGYIKEYVIRKDHNFSVAIDSEHGLITPNIKKVNEKSIMQIHRDLKDLVDRAKTGNITANDYEGSTFSVSSVGNIGGKYFVPTILSPQAAIIAIGKAYTTPKYTGKQGENHNWEPMETVSFSISADHRIIDGATVARFSSKMKSYIENYQLMMISL